MAVAAAIGVDADVPESQINNGIGNRLNNKAKLSASSERPATSARLGELNRSIEKMRLDTHGGSLPPPTKGGVGGGGVKNSEVLRRDSNWTNSTEGYGSMRSGDQSRRCSQLSNVSRHCSELSGMSQVSVSNVPRREEVLHQSFP